MLTGIARTDDSWDKTQPFGLGEFALALILSLLLQATSDGTSLTIIVFGMPVMMSTR